MFIKIVLVVVILLLLRRNMGALKPFWPLVVGLTTGALVGWWFTEFLIDYGVDFSFVEDFGCPKRMVKFIAALIGALAAVKPVSAAIYSLLPADGVKKNELR